MLRLPPVSLQIRQHCQHHLFKESTPAPKNRSTIPHLELLAILIGVRAYLFVKDQIVVKCEPVPILWSDSKVAFSSKES